MKNISIGRAIPGEEDEIVHVIVSARMCAYVSKEHGIARDDFVLSNDAYAVDMAMWAERIIDDSAGNQVLVARYRGNVVGICYATDRARDGRRIQMLYILPEYWRKGIGTLLVNETLAWFGCKRPISLDVLAYNMRAQTFYRQLGFEMVNIEIEVAGSINGKHVPIIEMIKKQ